MPDYSLNRRAFLGAAGAFGATGLSPRNGIADTVTSSEKRLPREVWIASITQDGLSADSSGQMLDMVLERLKPVERFEPDIVCLPETFAYTGLPRPLDEIAEEPPGPVTGRFAEFARAHACYVICPTYTRHEGRMYNASVLIDRDGNIAGEYHKIRPTKGEVESGIVPGPLEPPVFDTDFGRIGMQICFDMEWPDGWERLGKAGAEIVFWSSAFAGGGMVGMRACMNRYCVVSGTNKNTARISDITGETVAATGLWNRWICAPLNLEKAFLHTWPFVRRFDEIQRKYGRAVRITNHHEEEWSIIESLSPDIRVADIIGEFDLMTMSDHLAEAERAQAEKRP